MQYDLLKSARKRFEKHIPATVGAWLAGIYDRDRPVSKAASDGIYSFLDTDEKVTKFWQRCQPQILDFVKEALAETSATLSDERTVNEDDSLAKYDRVMGAAFSLITGLLTKLTPEDMAKRQDSYEELLVGNKVLWGFVASKNPFLRKMASELLIMCLEKQPLLIEKDIKTVGNAFINEGLKGRGLGSGLQYLKALGKLTAEHPSIWTMVYKSKTLPFVRLSSFVKKGSFVSPPEYWIVLSSMLLKLPRGVLPETLAECKDFLRAVQEGVTNKDEPKANVGTAWICYINVVKLLLVNLPAEDRCPLLVSSVYPLFEAFLRPIIESQQWTMGNSTAALAKAFHLCIATDDLKNTDECSIRNEWKRLADVVVTNLQTSLPEQSKDYKNSQIAVIGEAHRWFNLQNEILSYHGQDKTDTSRYKPILVESSARIVNCALEVLTARNGKPFGAAGALEGALRFASPVIEDSPETVEAIMQFLGDELPRLITSPSSSFLVASLKLYSTLPGKLPMSLLVWEACVNEVITRQESLEKAAAAETLVQSRKAAHIGRQNEGLQRLLYDSAQRTLHGSTTWRRVNETAILFNMYSDKTIELIFDLFINALNDPDQYDNAVNALEYVVGHRPDVLEIDESRRIAIMTRLLAVSESGDPGAISRAKMLRKVIADIPGVDSAATIKRSPIVSIIQDNLETAGPLSLS